jgi:hypothetical protein
MWLFLCYLTMHFGSYIFLFRHLEVSRGERLIFLYHAIPAVVVSGAVLLGVIVSPTADGLAAAALIIAAQGVYSLSFLELWSLAQGGYSVNILTRFEQARIEGVPPDMADLESIGAGKKLDRLAGLQRLCLIRRSDRGFALTRQGRIAAGVLDLVVCLANVKEAG